MTNAHEGVRIGLVGAGDWGRNILRNLYEIPFIRLKACCDVDPEARAFVGAQYPEVALFEDMDAFLAQAGVDATVISSPARTHFPLAMQALETGLHTFVEKPLALSAAEAGSLKALAEKTGRVLMVGHLMHYHPAVSWIRDWLKSGKLGTVFYFSATRSNLGRIRKDESVLWSLGPHDISICLDLFGAQPLSVHAQGGCFHHEGLEDVVFATLLFPQEIVAHLHLSRLTPHKVRQITLVGSNAMLAFDDMENREKVKIYYRGKRDQVSYESYGEAISLRFGDISLPNIEMVEPLRLECEHFVRCISGNSRPDTGGEEGERVVRVLEALERSLKNGGRRTPL